MVLELDTDRRFLFRKSYFDLFVFNPTVLHPKPACDTNRR